MATKTTQWILEMVDKLTGPLHTATAAAEGATTVVDQTTDSVEELGRSASDSGGKLEKLGKGMFFLNQIGEAVDKVNGAFQSAIEPGVRFQTAVADMSATTGMVGEGLKKLSDNARDTAKAFGTDAAKAADVYKVLLSKLTPELAKAPDALALMSNNVMTLSKTMSNDVPGATVAMTTAMNQYQVSMDDPIAAAKTMTEYMNIMAAGAQEGSSEVTTVAAALEQTGSVAKTFGVRFAETNAAIQLLDKSGKKGSEGGIALRNAIIKMQAPTSDAVKQLKAAGVNMDVMQNRSLSLTDRLRSLAPVMDNATIMSSLFGSENLASAMALIQGTDQIDTWTEALQGSTAATDMAVTNMDTYAERMNRMNAWIDDLKLSFFNLVEPIGPAIQVTGIFVGGLVTLGMVAFSVTQIMSVGIAKTSIMWIAGMAKMAMSTLVSSRLMTTAIMGIPVIGWIIGIVTAIASLIAYFYNTSAEFRAFLFGLWEFIKTAFTEYFKFIVNVVKSIVAVINPANWFDEDFHFSDVWDNLAKQTYEGGKRVGNAFQEGRKKGLESFANKDKGEETALKLDTSSTLIKETPLVIPAGGGSGSGKGAGTAVGLGGSGGSGGSRNITMNVTFNNHFQSLAATDERSLADKIMREITSVLNDANTALG